MKSFPQTQSFQETISNQQFTSPVAGAMYGPSAGPGMGGPVAGAMYGPNAGPGMGGPVAGAMAPPRPNMMAPMGGQMGGYGMPNAPVMGAMSPMHHGKGKHKSCGCNR